VKPQGYELWTAATHYLTVYTSRSGAPRFRLSELGHRFVAAHTGTVLTAMPELPDGRIILDTAVSATRETAMALRKFDRSFYPTQKTTSCGGLRAILFRVSSGNHGTFLLGVRTTLVESPLFSALGMWLSGSSCKAHLQCSDQAREVVSWYLRRESVAFR